MASKAFHIEIRVSNIEDPERLLAMRQSLQRTGRILFSEYKLIAGDSCDPEIILYGEDFTDGKQEITVQDEDEPS